MRRQLVTVAAAALTAAVSRASRPALVSLCRASRLRGTSFCYSGGITWCRLARWGWRRWALCRPRSSWWCQPTSIATGPAAVSGRKCRFEQADRHRRVVTGASLLVAISERMIGLSDLPNLVAGLLAQLFPPQTTVVLA